MSCQLETMNIPALSGSSQRVYLQQSDEITQLQRNLGEERRRREMAENTYPLLLTILVFVVCAGGLAIFSHSDFAAYEWLVKMNSVESQMANGLLRLEADEAAPSVVRNVRAN